MTDLQEKSASIEKADEAEAPPPPKTRENPTSRRGS